MADDSREKTISVANLLEGYLEAGHLDRLDISESRAGKLRAELESVALELRRAALGQ